MTTKTTKTTEPVPYYQLNDYPSLLREEEKENSVPDRELVKKAPPLLLYFDINGTIFTRPTADQRELKQVILDMLAQTTLAIWQPDMNSEISYSRYLNDYVIEKKLKRTQQERLYWEKLVEFLPRLEQVAPHIYPSVLKRFENIQASLKASCVFASFYTLIQELKRNNIVFSVILRTQGTDADFVKEEIHRSHPHFFSFEGNVGGDRKLYIRDQGKQSMYKFFNQKVGIANGIIKDSKEHPKKFPLELDKSDVLPIFFDGRSDKVKAYDPITRDDIRMESLQEQGHFYQVDTQEAILNRQYFFNLVRKSIELFEKRMPPRKPSVPPSPRKCCCFSFRRHA